MMKNELPDILIYRKKKYIIPGFLGIFLALLLLSLGLTFGVVAYVGEDPTEAAREMFQLESLIYLLPGLAIVGVPALLIYAVVHIGERRFLRVYRSMPEEAKRGLYEEKMRRWVKGGQEICEAGEYILFHDRCLFGTPQIVKIPDIVWGYIGHSDFQYTNMEKNYISPNLRFYSLYFHTKDGRRHRVFLNVSYQEAAGWFTGRCPKAILGYGKEQKRQAEEIFRREAEQTAFLTGEEKDSYLIRRRRTIWAAIGGVLLAVLLLITGFYTWQYSNSDTYLYRENMKEADKYFAEEEWSRAYQYYYAARDYRTDDEEATKGMLLSCLGMAKTDGYIDSIIQNYENLFYHQDLFTDEIDISEWYFECTDYYLKYDDPMGAVDLLERGMETFENVETVTAEELSGEKDDETVKEAEKKKEEERKDKERKTPGSREQILQKMQNKKDDILAHCQISEMTKYLYGERSEYTQYDEQGQEVLNVFYFNGYSRWEYNSYDKDGNKTLVEIQEKKDGEEDKEKIWEYHMEYDEQGNLLHEERYDLKWNEGKMYESISRYDKDGNRIYYKDLYNGVVFSEKECCVLSDGLRIDREYDADYPEGEQYSYTEEKRDEKGMLIETAYYKNSYSVEEIQDGSAVPWSRYYYTYDEQGNTLTFSYRYGSGKEIYPIYENEYDDRNHLVKENYYYRNEDEEAQYYSCTERYYNEEDLLVKKVINIGDDKEVWPESTETYTYDETGHLLRTDHLSGDGTGYSIVREYDILGNQVKEYKVDNGTVFMPEDMAPDKAWEYKYHYSKKNLRWEH